MNPLQLLISTEYKESIRSKVFWIVTFVTPILLICFGLFIGYLSEDSDVLTKVANPVAPDNDGFTPEKLVGFLFGTFLVLFLITYGAQIFGKVKIEKTNRIMEIMATAVSGRDMMLAKVIAVGLTGLTQILLWAILVICCVMLFKGDSALPFMQFVFSQPYIWKAIGWGLIFFIGGYIFYGSLFACMGAFTDKNNENQGYMTILTFLLLGAFYISEYIVDHPGGQLAVWCTYIPFTAPSVATVRTISGGMPMWQTILSFVVLYGFSFLSISFAGKLYTAGILMRGQKLKPKDIITIIRAK